MSETDDTDDLLLMPPDVVETHFLEDNFVPYYQIVDKLITQVSKLKSKITKIENSSDISLGSITNSIDNLINMRGTESNTCRRCYSCESLPQQSNDYRKQTLQCFSTQSTPQKPRSKLMLKSIPNSPKFEEELACFKRPNVAPLRAKIDEGDYMEESKSQEFVEENSIMKEIDEFLANVKPSSKPEVARALDFDKCSGCSEKHSKTLMDVEQILKEMDEQEEKIKNMLDDRTDTNSMENSEKNVQAKCSSIDWKKGLEMMSITSTDTSLTEKYTVLHQSAEKPEKTREQKTESRKILRNSKSQPNQNSTLNSSISNLESMDNNGSARMNACRKSVSNPQVDIHTNAKDAMSMHRKLLDETKFNNSNENSTLGTLSLVNLWGRGRCGNDQTTEKCIQKLQEEKLRRTHCEEMIQELQNKILEQQEKLAVAIQVDEAKDTAIIKFHDAWERATQKFKTIFKEKEKLETERANLAQQNKKIVEEYEERIEFHRKETNQALKMVQEHQNRLENLDKKVQDLCTENETLKSSTEKLENKLSNEEEKNKQLSSILANKEIELNESKNILQLAKKEVAQCKAAVDICQKDFATIKTEYDLIQDEIKTERMNVSQLHDQNKVLYDELETQKKNEQALLDKLKEALEKLENNKKELRNFYQGQVELLVQTKLKEFQKQLDEAERKMKEELTKKELEIAKSAALHIQQIQDKYSLEINLIEQKHQEEMQLKQVKTAQLEQRLSDLQHKFENRHEKKADLVKQLQKVMEVQWMEALRIINVPQDESSSTIDQLNSLQSKSYQNMEALLSDDLEEKTKNFNARHDKKNHQKYGDNNGIPRNKNATKHDGESLQKYINLLLHKQPGNPLENKEKSIEHPTNDRAWPYPEPPHYAKLDYENSSQFEENKKKTPWK